ncbi:serine/threonine-protein kinase CDG1-like isoform X2 [Diospyros lotus]|uniref:serine/threonine-protein kinase CDG1-like isoform X2 n=1 Tax=Diospyros lotus TaxID=55363 RepID=UPI0022559DC6|nr:serine/threonine-protein kinase CDG1-like isoform X2 [Diospyros lotus]
MGLEFDSSPAAESVIVVMDANRSKVSGDALEWAIKHVVRRGYTVIVLGVFSDGCKKISSPSGTSCFPFRMWISLSSISVRIEYSGSVGQGDLVNSRELEDKIEKKREEYQRAFHPFYRKCSKNQVKLELKLAAGYDPRSITIDEAQQCNPRWIVLESQLKKYRVHIYRQVACNMAVMKGKGVATLMPSRAREQEEWPADRGAADNVDFEGSEPDQTVAQDAAAIWMPPTISESPCFYPLSCRDGFPRAFSLAELQLITNGFSAENLIGTFCTYEGICQDTPVLVKRYSANDDRFWSVLNILSRVRHRNILNLVGYCCTEASMFLLCDFPCSGTVEMNLLCDEAAKRLSWRRRWYIAMEIGIGIRYLHEECVDGPIADLSVCSSRIAFSEGYSAMLVIINTAKWLKDRIASEEDSPADLSTEENKRILADIQGYGMFLVELITGKSAGLFQDQGGNDQSLIDWALPLLENGFISQVIDPRLVLVDASDSEVVNYMARAALLCLKNDTGRKFSISEVLALVRGHQLVASSP